MLVATADGVIIAAIALRTLYQISDTSISAQRADLTVLKASSSVGQNLEGFVGSTSSMRAYPGIAAEIAKGMAVQQQAIDSGLQVLATNLSDAAGQTLIMRMQADWASFEEFITAVPETSTAAELATLSEAADGAGNIAATITGVSEATRRTTDTIDEARHAAGEPAAMSRRLQDLVSRFRY